MYKKIKEFFFQNRSLKQTLLKNTFWLGFGQITGRLIRVVIIIYAARILGAASYGAFSYAVSLAAIFTIFADFGINLIITREAAKDMGLKSQYISTAFTIKIALIIFAALLMIFVAPLFTKVEGAVILLPIMAALLVFDAFRDFSYAVVRAAEKMEIEAGIVIFNNVALVILGFMALIISPTPIALALAYTSASGLGMIAAIWFTKKELLEFRHNFQPKLIKPIFANALPLALLGLLGGFIINTDVVMLGWFRTAAEVGFYSAAQKPIQFLYALPNLLAIVILPVFARLTANKEESKSRFILEKTLTAVLIIAIPLTIGGIILGADLIKTIYGNDYLPATSAFKIILLTLPLVSAGYIIGSTIFSYNRQNLFFISFSTAALGNIVLNFILIPPYGTGGAAVASFIAQILNNGLLWRMMKKINDFKILPRLKKTAAAAVLMTILTLTMKLTDVNFFINVFLSGLFYFGTLHYFKEEIITDLKNTFRQAW